MTERDNRQISTEQKRLQRCRETVKTARWTERERERDVRQTVYLLLKRELMSAHLLSAKAKSARTKAEIESKREKEDSAHVCGRAFVPVTVYVKA